MPRSYPQYLYSNPQNTKSKGPFIVHTIPPRFIVQVTKFNGSCNYDKITWWDEEPEGEIITRIVKNVESWFDAQVKSGEIKF